MLLTGIERQTLLTNVFDNINVMVWVKDSRGNLIYINKFAMKKIFNCEDSSHILKNKCPLSCKAQEVCNEIEVVIEDVEINEKLIHLKCTKVPIETGGVIVIAEDVTDEIIKEKKMLKDINEKIIKWKINQDEKFRKTDERISNMNSILKEIKEKRNIR